MNHDYSFFGPRLHFVFFRDLELLACNAIVDHNLSTRISSRICAQTFLAYFPDLLAARLH